MTTFDRVISAVREERKRQDKKWGTQCYQNHFIWLGILSEEVGEFSEALLRWYFYAGKEGYSKHSQCMKDELVQVAAVAIAQLEQMEIEQGALAEKKQG